MKLSEGKLKHMKALSNDRGVVAAAAMDQRGSLQKSLATARGVDTKEITTEMMSEFKVAVTRALPAPFCWIPNSGSKRRAPAAATPACCWPMS